MGNTIKGVVFDLDETLIDSKDSIVAYHRELFKYLGLEFPEDHAYWFYTLPAEEITNRLFPDESYREKAREFRKNFDFRKLFKMIRLKPGVPEILNRLRESGKKLAVVTNRGISTRPVLEHFNLLDLFDIVLPANEVKFPKPDPYPLKVIMEKWKAERDEIIYIGDSEIDVETGTRAGVYTVTVGRKFSGVNYIPTLEYLPDLIRKFEKEKVREGVAGEKF